MQLHECYRILDLGDGATDQEIKQAHRDLTKVWHPDRFAHDPLLQEKAEEKLKKINEAFETIEASRSEHGWRTGKGSARSGVETQRLSSYRRAAIFFTLLGFLIALRRPTAGGLAAAMILFILAMACHAALRRAQR